MESIRRLMFIVSPSRPDLFASLRRTFAGDDSVQVVLDRRRSERRLSARTTDTERRRATDRRMDREVERKLRERGYAVVATRRAAAGRRPR